MKKFTSLFALLSCLCVVSAQATDVTIYVYASNPDNQHIYWYEGQAYHFDDADPWNTWGTFSQSPLIKDMGSFDGIFYKIKLKLGSDNHIMLKFFTGTGGGQNETEAIKVTSESDKYYYYFGGTNYSKENSFNFYLSGTFNNWGEKQAFTSEGNGKWTKTLEGLSNQVQFKVRPGEGWLGYNTMFSEGNPYGFVYRWNGGEHDDNIMLDPAPNITKYKLTVTWIPNNNPSLTIEGVELNLTDNTEFSTELNLTNLTVGSASYTRSNVTSEWGTLCLPFEIKNSYDGVTFYSLSAVDETNKVLTFTPVEGAISAGEPVVYKSTSKSLNISETDVDVVPIVNEVSDVIGWTLYGSFVAMSNVNPESGKYLYYIANDQFYKSKENANVPAYRAYFIADVNLVDNTNPGQAPIRIEVADSEDIQFVDQEDGTVKAYYDLQGRKLDSAHKGLVIENGKIIMVK